MRQTADGRLVYPTRGKPPECPEGYKRDPGNDFIFIPILRPCPYRKTESRKLTCKVCLTCLHCVAYAKDVTARQCRACPMNSVPDSVDGYEV